jgi:hypothetical protein
MRKFLCLLLITAFLTGCSGLFPRRTFIDEMDRESDGVFVPGKDFEISAGDSGSAYRSRNEVLRRTPAAFMRDGNLKEQRSLMGELTEKERKLTRREYRQYRELDDQFGDESERLYYLGLSRNEREDYLRSKQVDRAGLGLLSGRLGVEASELRVGMGKNEVLQGWGRPARKDYAGNPTNENERWSFYRNGKLNHIYFESGEVHGWAVD